MTFKLVYSEELPQTSSTGDLYIPLKEGVPSYTEIDHGLRKYKVNGWLVPPLSGDALKYAASERYKYSFDIGENEHWVFVLRKDQLSRFEKSVSYMKHNLGITMELMHKSVDFTNLNYLLGNYLNLYIYKVTKHA